MRRKPLFLIIPIILCLLIAFSFAESSYDASTMRLLRHNGTVQIYDVSGAPRFLLDNVRFASGEAMETGEDGTASVSLDDSKVTDPAAQISVAQLKEDGILLKKGKKGFCRIKLV